MKRYLILAGYIVICLSLLVACGQTPTATVYSIENEVTMGMSDVSGDASGDASGEASETAETTSIEESSSDIEEKIEAIKNWKDIGKIYVDGELIGQDDIQGDFNNYHIYLRVEEGSTHDIKLLGFDKIDPNVKYEWTHVNVSSVNNAIESIETGAIYKKEYYDVSINTNTDKNELEHIYGYIPYNYLEININFHFSVENHLRIYQAGAEDTHMEQLPNRTYLYASGIFLPDDADSVTYTVEAYADNMDGMTYEWFEYDGYPVEGGNQTPSITLTREELGRSHRECIVTDKYGNALIMVFEIGYIDNHFQVYLDGEKEKNSGTLVKKNIVLHSYEDELTFEVGVSADDMEGIIYKWVMKGETLLEGEECSSITLTREEIEEKRTINTHVKCVVTDKLGNHDYAYFYIEIEN